MEEDATAVEGVASRGVRGLYLIIGLGVLLAVGLVLAGLLVGLKSGGADNKANAASASSSPGLTDAQRAAMATKFVACLRANGVPNFPDPGADGSIRVQPKDNIDPTSEKYQAADQKCDSLRPPSRNQPGPNAVRATADTTAYVECMRQNGIPDFPSPDADGTFAKINAPSATIKKAHEACKSHLPAGAPPPPS